MVISSYTNYANKKGVEVHKRGATDLLMSANVINGVSLEESGLSNRLEITVYNSGILSGTSGSNSIENIHSGGSAQNGIITNHTVQNVLYGGKAISCSYGSNCATQIVDSTVATSTVISSTEDITHGNIKRVGYIASTIYAYNVVTARSINGDDATGSAIITNSGRVESAGLQDRGKIFIRHGGVASNVVISGAGRIDVYGGGKLLTVTEKANYSLDQASAHGTIVTNVRTCISAVYGVPTSGYKVGNDYLWYLASDSGMSSGYANIMTVANNTDRSVASCVLNCASEGWSELNGTYSLLIESNANVDSWFMSARAGVWKNANTSSPTHYLAIEYVEHDDGFPYWDLNDVSANTVVSGSGTSTVYTKTLKAFAPAYTDVISSSTTDASNARIVGPEMTIFSNGAANSVNVPTYGHLTVESCGILSNGQVKDYGTLTANKYSVIGISKATPVVIALNGEQTINLPGQSIKKYVVTGNIIPDTESSQYLDETGAILPEYSGIVSELYIPLIHTSRPDGNAIGVVADSASVTASGIKLTKGDTVYTNNGVVIDDFHISAGGKILFNDGASGITGYVSAGGVLNIMNAAYGSNINIHDSGRLNLDPLASGNYNLSSGCYVSCTMSRYAATYTLAESAYNSTFINEGVVDYTAEHVAVYTWSCIDGVAATFTSTASRVLSYNVTSGNAVISGSMTSAADPDERTIIYIDSSTTGETCGIVDTDDTLVLVKYNATKTSSAILGSAVLGDHTIVGTTYTNYVIGNGVNAFTNVTDRVHVLSTVTADSTHIPAIRVVSAASCTLNVYGDVLIQGALITGTPNFTTILNGYVTSTISGSVTKHVPQLVDIDAESGMTLSMGQYAKANTIPLSAQNTSYKSINLVGTIEPDLSASLNLAQGQQYQFVGNVTSNSITSALAVGIAVNSDTLILGSNAYGYGMLVSSGGDVKVQSNGYLIGATLDSSGRATVEQSGYIYQAAAKGSDAVVEVAQNATCEITATDKVNVTRKATVGSNAVAVADIYTLSRGYTAAANRADVIYNVYTQLTPTIAGPNLHTNSSYAADVPFWYCSGIDRTREAAFLNSCADYTGNMVLTVWFDNALTERTFVYVGTAATTKIGRKWYASTDSRYQMEYISSTDARTISNGIFAGSAIGAVKSNQWAIIRYTDNARSAIDTIETLPSAVKLIGTTNQYILQACSATTSTAGNVTWLALSSYQTLTYANTYNNYSEVLRTPFGTYNTVYPNYETYLASYTNRFNVIPATTNPVRYVVKEGTRISGILTGSNNGIVMDAYRTGNDNEGQADSAIYYHTDSWTNSGSTFYDSGVLATTSGRIVVAGRTLVGPTVLSNGYIYMYSSGIINNATQEQMGVINTNFNRGYFYIDGHCVRTSSALTGKIDDHVQITGDNITGIGSTCLLNIVDELTAGDDRAWTNTFVTTKDIYTISNTVTLYASNALWNVMNTEVTKYTNPITMFKSAISSGSVASENVLLNSTVWTTGTLKFNNSGHMLMNTHDVGVMSHITYGSDGTITYPSGIVITDDQKAAIASGASALFVNFNDPNYIIVTSNTDINAMSYDSGIKSYVAFDMLDGVLASATTSSNVTLESGGHTRDPWWIDGKHSELNTGDPAVFTGYQSIMRANTTYFEVSDKTNNYTINRVIEGATIENVSSNAYVYVTYSDIYVGLSGYFRYQNALGRIKDMTINGGGLYVNSCTNMENVSAIGAGAFIEMYADPRHINVSNVVVLSNSVLRACSTYLYNSNCGITPTVSARNVAGRTLEVPYMPFTMSGTNQLYVSMQAYAGTNMSGMMGMFEDYICNYMTGVCNTPYLMAKHISSANNNYNNNNPYCQYNNYDIKYVRVNSTGRSFGGSTSDNWTNQSCLFNNGYFKCLASGLMASSGETNVILRNECILDFVSSAGADIMRSDVYSWAYNGSRHVQTWITPVLTAVRSDVTTDYWNTQKPFVEDEFYLPSGVTYSGLKNSTYHPGVFSSGTANVTAGVPNYYLYGNYSSAMTVASTIVHVKPGAVIGSDARVTMGLFGGLFIDSHCIAFDVNQDAILGTTTMNVSTSAYPIHNTKLQNLRVLHDGIAIIVPNAGFYSACATNNHWVESTYAQLALQLTGAWSYGEGRVFYGKTVTGPTNAVWASANWSSYTSNTASLVTFNQNNGMDVMIYKDAYFYGNATTTARNNYTATTGRLTYVGPSGCIHCNTLYISAGATLLLDKGAKIDADLVYVNDGGIIVCMDDSINFNEKTYIYSSGGNTAYPSGTDYYSRTGTGTYNNQYVYTSVGTLTSSSTLPAGMYAKVEKGMKWRFGLDTRIKYMNGFKPGHLPNNSDRVYPTVNTGSIVYQNTPDSLGFTWGYDIPRSNATADTTPQATWFYHSSALGYNTVSGLSYKNYACSSGTYSGYNQVFTLQYSSGLVNPVTSKVFDGWAIDGWYEDENGVASSGHLYACSHANPVGSDWIAIDGRNNVPYINVSDYNGIGHVDKKIHVYDCGHTTPNVTYDDDNYPDIIFVNGFLSGTVYNSVTLGPAGVIASGTIIESGVKVGVFDVTDHTNMFNGVTGDGYIAFGGCSLLDNVSNVVVGIATDTTSPTNCMFTMGTNGYHFNIRKCTDAVVMYNYTFSNTVTSDCIMPFVLKGGTITGSGAGNIICAQPISSVLLTNGTKATTTQLTYDVKVNSGASCIVESKMYKACVSSATMVVSKYARNILVGANATITIAENASCDNLQLLSGATAYISGYVTGFKNSGGTVMPVDSRFIRTEVLFDEDYNWD